MFHRLFEKLTMYQKVKVLIPAGHAIKSAKYFFPMISYLLLFIVKQTPMLVPDIIYDVMAIKYVIQSSASLGSKKKKKKPNKTSHSLKMMS